jgi:hypothetical protein
VLADAVLAWPLLKRGGVMIFDDYKWTKLSPDYFRPKPAIDAFMKCMTPELNVLDIQYQVFVEKRIEFEEPKRTLGGTIKRKNKKRNSRK